MNAAQLKLLLFAIFIGFSFFSWLFKQIAKKRAEAEQIKRMRAAQLETMRTGRSGDSAAYESAPAEGAASGRSSGQGELTPIVGSSSAGDERQRKLSELRRRAAQRSSGQRMGGAVANEGSAQVLAPQGSVVPPAAAKPNVLVLPGGVTIKLNPQKSAQAQVVGQQQRGTPARQQQKQKSRQPQTPRQTSEQKAHVQRQQAMARQPVPAAVVSRNPVSDSPDASETKRLNVDTDAPTVTSRGGRRSPVRNLASLSQRDLRTAFILSEVFGSPKSFR